MIPKGVSGRSFTLRRRQQLFWRRLTGSVCALLKLRGYVDTYEWRTRNLAYDAKGRPRDGWRHEDPNIRPLDAVIWGEGLEGARGWHAVRARFAVLGCVLAF